MVYSLCHDRRDIIFLFRITLFFTEANAEKFSVFLLLDLENNPPLHVTEAASANTGRYIMIQFIFIVVYANAFFLAFFRIVNRNRSLPPAVSVTACRMIFFSFFERRKQLMAWMEQFAYITQKIRTFDGI